MPEYIEPDFNQEFLQKAPDAVMAAVEKDFVAPDNYHATTIFPEYFKVNGHALSQSKAVWTVWRFTIMARSV